MALNAPAQKPRLSRLTAANRTEHASAAVAAAVPLRMASPGALMLWRFQRHRVAVASLFVLIAFYVVALFAEFFAPYLPNENLARYPSVPPQTLHLFRTDGTAGFRFDPYVEGYTSQIDVETRTRRTVIDTGTRHDVRFLVPRPDYALLGVGPLGVRFLGPVDPSAPFFLFGSDRLGRDVLSRTIHGARVSLTIGLVGVGLSLVLGVTLGGVSGYFGGATDTAIQRVIEFLQSLPTIPLWMGLAAAIPVGMPPLQVYLMITVILSLIGWTSLAREVRGKFMALKGEDFVTAARLDGASLLRTIRRHMVPSFASHIIASVTLAIPAMILAETALSFLGIGLRPPVVSWGVLLQDAQNIRALATAPWLLLPGAAVVVSVLAFNFLGDGLRDAADPYAH